MFVFLNTAIRRQRRRVALVAAVLALAGAVVTAHSVMAVDHMGDGAAMCLAVAETAVIAIGGVLVLHAAIADRNRWLLPVQAVPEQPAVAKPVRIRPRAGPSSLQVFRL